MSRDEFVQKLSRLPTTGASADTSPNPNTTEDITAQSSSTEISPNHVCLTYGADVENANLRYDVYAIYTFTESTTVALEVLGQSFKNSLLSHLPKPAPSLSLCFYALSDLESCLNHYHRQSPRDIGSCMLVATNIDILITDKRPLGPLTWIIRITSHFMVVLDKKN